MKLKIIYIFGIMSALFSFANANINNKIIITSNTSPSRIIDIRNTNLDKARLDLPNDEAYKNSQRQDLYRYIATYRKNNNLNGLTINSKLETAAQKFAKYLSDNGKLTHLDAKGETTDKRFGNEGLAYSFRGEILSSSIDLSGAVSSRYNSPLHRQVFNSQLYNRIGVGYEKGMRVVIYYYDKPVITKSKKTCVARNYRKVKNRRVKSTCKQFK